MALVTLSGVKQYYDIDTTDADRDSLFTELIDKVSSQFETICDRKFESAEYTEYYDGDGSKFLFVDQYPITSVSGIWDDSDWSWATSSLVDSDDYMIKNNTTIVLKASTFGNYEQNVKIVYTAGYTTIPDDLQQACIEEVLRKYKSRHSIDITSTSLEDGSITHTDKNLMPQTIQILGKYRKLYLA